MEISSIKSTLNFGKYKGKTINYLIKNDPEYIYWVLINVKTIKFNDEISNLIIKSLPYDPFSEKEIEYDYHN